MKILSIDTSTKNFSLALSEDEEILTYKNIKLCKNLDSSVVPSIENLLKGKKIALSKLGGIAVGLGPGSFTSLRVGLSAVKALAFALEIPVVGISSLDVLAIGVSQEKAYVCTVCDARRGLVYGCSYQKNKEVLRRHSPYLLTELNILLDQINQDAVFAGDGNVLYRDQIEKQMKHKGLNATYEKEGLWFPQARFIPLLVMDRFRKKKFDNLEMLSPLYLYPEDCQVVKK